MQFTSTRHLSAGLRNNTTKCHRTTTIHASIHEKVIHMEYIIYPSTGQVDAYRMIIRIYHKFINR